MKPTYLSTYLPIYLSTYLKSCLFLKHYQTKELFTSVISFLLRIKHTINPLNAELNAICHFLALQGAHHILHLSGLRVKNLYFLKDFIILKFHVSLGGTAVAQWLRCCATNRKVAGSIPASVNGFFFDIKSFRSHYGPGVDTTSNINEYQEHFLGVKAAGA